MGVVGQKKPLGSTQKLGESQYLSGLFTVDPCEGHGCLHNRSEGPITVPIWMRGTETMQEGQETLLDCPRHLHHRTETFSEGKGNDDSLRAQINTLCLCEQGAVEGKILVLGEE